MISFFFDEAEILLLKDELMKENFEIAMHEVKQT